MWRHLLMSSLRSLLHHALLLVPSLLQAFEPLTALNLSGFLASQDFKPLRIFACSQGLGIPNAQLSLPSNAVCLFISWARCPVLSVKPQTFLQFILTAALMILFYVSCDPFLRFLWHSFCILLFVPLFLSPSFVPLLFPAPLNPDQPETKFCHFAQDFVLSA